MHARHIGRRVEQPVRYAPQLSRDQWGLHTELLGEILHALEEEQELHCLKRLLCRWQSLGFSLRQLDDACKSTFGSTLFACACYESQFDVARFLLSLDFDFSVKDDIGRGALHWACQCGWSELAGLLIEKGSQVDVPDRNSETALCFAARNGHIDIVRLLLENGADVNANGHSCQQEPEKQAHTPLENASNRGHIAIAKALLESGADTNLAGVILPIEAAFANGPAAGVEILLQARARTDLATTFGLQELEKVMNGTPSPAFAGSALFPELDEKVRLLQRYHQGMEHVENPVLTSVYRGLAAVRSYESQNSDTVQPLLGPETCVLPLNLDPSLTGGPSWIPPGPVVYTSDLSA